MTRYRVAGDSYRMRADKAVDLTGRVRSRFVRLHLRLLAGWALNQIRDGVI